MPYEHEAGEIRDVGRQEEEEEEEEENEDEEEDEEEEDWCCNAIRIAGRQWVELGSFPGGVETREDADQRTGERSDADPEQGCERRPAHERGHEM